jgi:hypothetical protein
LPLHLYFAAELAVAFASLVVIPEGDLLLPLLFPADHPKIVIPAGP